MRRQLETTTRLAALAALAGIALSIAACSAGSAGGAGASAGAGTGAGSSAGAGSSTSASAPAATTDLCGLFTLDEVGAVLGEPVKQGTVAGPLDTGCQWQARGSDADVMIQKVPADYWEDWSKAKGYHEIAGVGRLAYVSSDPFGIRAGALTDDAVYLVVVSPAAKSEDDLVGLLRAFVDRGAAINPWGAGVPSEPPESAATPAPAGSCPLSAAQVTKVMGVEMAESGPCSWSAKDAGGVIEVYYAELPSMAFSPSDGEAVAGVGDEAYVDGAGVLYVRTGDRVLSIQVLAMGAPTGVPASKDAAVQLARLILGGGQ